MSKIGDYFRDGTSQAVRHPWQSLMSLVAGVAVPGAGLAAQQMFDGLNRSRSDKSTAAWLAANGGVPADLGGNGTGIPAGAPPLLSSAIQQPTRPSGGATSPLVTGDALAAFQNSMAQRLAGEIGDGNAEITANTLAGNYSHPGASAPRGALGSFNAGATGGSDSRSGFSALTGSSRSTNDIGGILGSLGFVGMNDKITHGGEDNGRGVMRLRQAAANGDENAKRLLEERMANIRAGGNTGMR